MIDHTGHIPHKYAWICAEMQRFGRSRARMPEIGGGGLILLVPGNRNSQDGHQSPSGG